MLIYKNDKIVVPKMIKKYVINWYNIYLLLPSMDCTEITNSQHYYYNQFRNDIRTRVKVCKNCKKRQQSVKYGKLSAKEAEAIPKDRLLVYFIGPYIMRREYHDNPLVLKHLTMIDPATRCSKRVLYNDKQSAIIVNLKEKI